MQNINRKEISEAISSCDRVLNSIYAARGELKGAKNWGLVDMLGGGLFTGLIKHSKMGQAQNAMSDITRELRILQKELHDVSDAMEIRMNNTQLDMVLDLFFDNIFTDWNTQSKIGHALNDLDELEADIIRLRSTLSDLYAQESR